MENISSYCTETTLSKLVAEKRRLSNWISLVKEIDPELSKELLNHSIIGFEKLVELTLACLMKEKWTDIAGADLGNGDEVKTATIGTAANNSRKLQIKNLNTKTGDLRVVVYNSVDQEFTFYHLPYSVWSKNYNPNITRGYFVMSFPRYQRPKSWWAKYQFTCLKKFTKSKYVIL